MPLPKTASKSPKSLPSFDFNKLSPSWRISYMEMCDPFGWHELRQEKLREIRGKLGELEKLTWNEILVARKHLNHTVQVDDICKEAKERLIELGLDDVDELVSLRLMGAERVWGFPMFGALTLLWWDPDHQVYPTALKNT